ncbi:Dipeptide-binding protein DppE [Microbacterium oxydans]|uniref:Dipeptide-binding protein DppE n=1 Tax=Microbacterium oxydans TaxID=82380 RepID=A0A3Q9J4X1_9MICO|nr:hypothetical protein [Microbacterium oxydans]AZS41262.1 Dipeptide-binding protein DppE [Microbacterium oxydans]
MKRMPLALAAAVAATLALTSCSGGATPSPSDGSAAEGPDALNIGNFLDITSWDPSLADIGFDGPYLSAVYDALIALDADGEPIPSLATDWTVADDDLSIDLDIRTDAVFSDGTPGRRRRRHHQPRVPEGGSALRGGLRQRRLVREGRRRHRAHRAHTAR